MHSGWNEFFSAKYINAIDAGMDGLNWSTKKKPDTP
jgi:hypothetical protein